jgi:plasmid stability protein
MRNLILSATLMLLAAMPVRAQEAEARAILEKAFKAQGDEKVAKSLKSATAKAKGSGQLEGMNFDFTILIYIQEPAKHKTIINLSIAGQNLDITQALNGDKGWITVMGMTMDMDEDDVKEAKSTTYVESVCSLWTIKSDKEMKVSTIGESKVGDKAVVGIQVTKKDQRDVNLYFDKSTNMLVKSEARGRHPTTKTDVLEEKFYTEFKELVPGVKMPSKIAINYDGTRFMEFEITEMTPVERHDDSVFARPD